MTFSQELNRRGAEPAAASAKSSAAALRAGRSVPGLPGVPNRVLGGGRPPGAPPPLRPGIPAAPPLPGIPKPLETPVPASRAQSVSGVRPAGRTVRVPPEAFAETWQHRPDAALEIGVRLIADADYDKARAHAARIAHQNHPGDRQGSTGDVFWEAYNEALMQWVVARGTCRADNVAAAFWECPQDVVPEALTPDGLRLLFDGIEELKLDKTPLGREADDGAIATLGALCQIDGLRAALLANGSNEAKRLRRLIHHLLAEVRLVVGPDVAPAEDADPEIGSVEIGSVEIGSVEIPVGRVE